MDTLHSATILDRIYDASLRPDSWQGFADEFCRTIGAHHLTMAFRLHREGPTNLRITAAPNDISDFTRRYFAHFTDANPFDYDAMARGRVYGLQDFLPDGRLESSVLYTQHLQPAGLGSLEMVAIGPHDGFRAYLAWTRDSSKGRLRQEELAWVSELMPHLERGLAIFGGWKLSSLANELYNDALDHLSFGAVALDGKGRILFSNRLANELLDRSTDLARREGRLVFADADHARIVSMLVADAANDLGPKPADRVLRLRAGDSMIAALLKPIVVSDAFGIITPARVMVYLHDLKDRVQPPTALLAELFGLAPAEATLAILLSEGLTLREAAERMGIMENSVRSYCKRIFAKMGIGRQADLVRLVLRSVAMLGGD